MKRSGTRNPEFRISCIIRKFLLSPTFEKTSTNHHVFLKIVGDNFSIRINEEGCVWKLFMPERVYPHLLRAERTTLLYRDGIDPILLSQILGHANIETTKIYAIPSIEQLREAMEKVPMPADAKEKPLWEGDEDEMARNCGLR